MFVVVEDPENYSLEELIQKYLDEGFDEESARIYSRILKNPPKDMKID